MESVGYIALRNQIVSPIPFSSPDRIPYQAAAAFSRTLKLKHWVVHTVTQTGLSP